MNHSLRLAFCSMAAALGTVVMILTGFIPVGTYALPAFSGILLIAVVAEVGIKWAVGVYVVQSVLSFMLAADQEAVLFFVLLFGYYPILKAVLESRVHQRWLCIVSKLVVFNAAAILEFWLSVKLLGVPVASFSVFGYNVPGLFLLAGNAVFLIYDYAVSLLVIAYFNRLHPVMKKWFHPK
ncbi:hypothetical protein EQM14_07630 [Caproiciproducens sp. NJN-50]|uniref:hypothetical protein n=1 Tax=Acutalibacteraceae TaxID=3082771 RepID=UPI000FFE1988|nr:MULTISPECIES: hypothetical protein [Acutalibacteraceae]QAT49653.1 hypothetical protein EQM14_07630 [Caproiciproducens sp. NJN-50]